MKKTELNENLVVGSSDNELKLLSNYDNWEEAKEEFKIDSNNRVLYLSDF